MQCIGLPAYRVLLVGGCSHPSENNSQDWIIPRLVFDYLPTLLVDHFDHVHPRKLTAGYPK